MNAGFIKLMEFYRDKGMDIEMMLEDIEHFYLTENITRDGREVYWYMDTTMCYCVDQDEHELSEEEIEAQLC